MLVPIQEINVAQNRRKALRDNVRNLANSISEVGLLNPITIDREHTLIAGLHRLEAAKLLGWTDIECTVSSLEGMQAQLAEIDENIVRSDLSAIEHGDLLLRRKEIYKALHPETKHGGDRKSEKIKTSKCRLDPAKPFVEDTAEKLGIGRRTVERQVQMAKNLTEEAKDIIRDSDAKITKKGAMKLSRLAPDKQVEAAGMLTRGEIHSVDEYLKKEQEASDSDRLDDEALVPFHTDSTHFSSFKESVADLKNPDKDCSGTPDSFLEEITAFVRKFHTEIAWFSTEYYKAVFPEMTHAQLDYLRGQMDFICSAADNLYGIVERKAKNELPKKA